MMNCIQSWPEPIVRVQSLSDSGIQTIPEQYVKNTTDRPYLSPITTTHQMSLDDDRMINIPIIDLQNLFSKEPMLRDATIAAIGKACKEWGFFQVVNHGVSHQLMADTREAWRTFFHLPVEEKVAYANSPTTYEGYGSRLGVEKGAKLDWNDYFFLHFLPTNLRDQNKWPKFPSSCCKLVEDYNEEMAKLAEKLMKVLSKNLGLKENHLEEALGGEEVGASLRVNFYPKCPQPDLTLGLSSHSDPGAMTLLLADDKVSGLQVRKNESWVTVKPVPNAIIVNIGDQIQVLSNATYKSVEHRVIVNSAEERVSLAFFYNPNGDKLIKPIDELVTDNSPSLYLPMTFNQYRTFIRTRGPSGKSQVDSLKSPR